jgi:hypothetical protein
LMRDFQGSRRLGIAAPTAGFFLLLSGFTA